MIVMMFDHQLADLEADTEAHGQIGHDLNNRTDICDEARWKTPCYLRLLCL